MEIPSYFRRYLRSIQPTRANREAAMGMHRVLRERLAADEAFADWYEDSFLYGSYRRNTAVQPIKDVDICVLLSIETGEHTPESVVLRLRRVLERNGYRGKTDPQRRSVRVDMSGATMDVVPVVDVAGGDEPLAIPDRPLREWVPTHPKGHLEAATQTNRECGKRYIPFVKIVRVWYRFQLREVERPKPKGFTLEALVLQYQDPDAPSYAEAFVRFLDALHRAHGAALARGTFPEVPDPGMPGQSLKVRVSGEEAQRFGQVVADSLSAARAALEMEGPVADSAAAWQEILGPAFPVLPAMPANRWEHTRYRGSHTMTCELHRSGIVLARARHVVSIR
jgi:hypothetical protein